MPRLQACFRVDDQGFCGPSVVCLQGPAASAYPAGAQDLWQTILSLPEHHTIHQHCWYILVMTLQMLSLQGDFCMLYLEAVSSAVLSKQQNLMAA